MRSPYLWQKSALTNNKDVIKYIGRYLGRPVIATSRIDNYDGTNVTFHYNRHENNALVTQTVSAVDFIKKLIIHIPEKHFKMIKYYGVYAKHHKYESKLFLAVPKEKDVSSHHYILGERLFCCHLATTHFGAGAARL